MAAAQTLKIFRGNHDAAPAEGGPLEPSFIEQAAHRAWWSLVIRGVLAVAVGVLILVRPMESVAAFALVVALWALMQGIVAMVHAFDIRPYAPHWWLLLLSGAVGTLFGLAALYYYPALSLAFVVLWAVWWLAIGGITAIGAALYERRSGMSWGWTFVWGILAIITAVVAFGNPPATLATLMTLIAVFAIVGGVVLLTAAIRVRNGIDRLTRTMSSEYSHAASR
jgi:uncharacterized membrane protein HdeD (DUF308 family)